MSKISSNIRNVTFDSNEILFKKQNKQQPKKTQRNWAVSFAARNRQQMPSIAPCSLGSTHTTNQSYRIISLGLHTAILTAKVLHNSQNHALSCIQNFPILQLCFSAPNGKIMSTTNLWSKHLNIRMALSLLLAFIGLRQILNFKTH